MDYFSLLTPWLVLVAIFIPLMMAESWVHQHFFGVVYLLTKDKLRATRAFYIAFLPGIFIHEFVQYLVAGALNVPIKKGFHWPEKQENGTLRLNFVVVERDKTDPFRAAVVAAAPLMLMMVIIWQISTQVLALDELLVALGKGDIAILWKEFIDLFKTGDFIIWFYLLFAIANAMIPKREDAQGWPLILGVMIVVIVVMVAIGLDEVLLETWEGPVINTLEHVNTALFLVLMMDVLAIFTLGMVEDSLERLRGIKMDYSGGENLTRARGEKEIKREPGSDLPYPKGEPLPSIYSFVLPIPDPSDRLPRPRLAEPEHPSVAVRPSALASRAPLTEKTLEEEQPAEETPPRERFARPGYEERDRVYGSGRRSDEPERPGDKSAEGTPHERAARPGYGERDRAFGRRTEETGRSGDKPAEETPRERFARPGLDRQSADFQRPIRRTSEENAQKPIPTERMARPSESRSPDEGQQSTVQRRFTPAPRRTQPFVLDEKTADELDTELEYVDFDDEVEPSPDDED